MSNLANKKWMSAVDLSVGAHSPVKDKDESYRYLSSLLNNLVNKAIALPTSK